MSPVRTCRCPKGGHGKQGTPPAHPAKPSPESTLLLDPFRKQIMGLRGWNSNGGSHASPKLHLREGGWRTYTIQHPLGGATSWQTGRPKRVTEKLNGPGQANVDFALSTAIRLDWLRESSSLTFRAEFFNAFNHPQYSNPDSNFTSPTFGVVSSTSVSARVLQLVLKFAF